MASMKTWLRDIERATSGAEVLSSTRDYLSLWSPRELPEDCREIRIEQAGDLARWKQRLSHSPPPGDDQGRAERLRELVAYLERACARLEELESRPH